jgi:hypothetical protein
MTFNNVALRIITTYIIFLIYFSTVNIASYFLLPQGLLLNKHPLQNWDTSPNLIISSIQILSYNLISVVVILFGNIYSVRKSKKSCYMSLVFLGFFSMITINAVVLGTWSFSVITDAVPLAERIIRTFDLLHKAGLWEMSGQLFILCATVSISLIITDGKETTKRSWRTIKLSKREIIVFCTGLIFMLLGALIESYSIINLK